MNSAIIVAAGKSRRMGQDKIFLETAGRPLIGHTWARFEASDAIQEIILVLSPGKEASCLELAARFGFQKPFRFAPGGSERQDSVWNGLQTLSPKSEIVAIQDGARPCTALELIAETVRAAGEMGAAVAAQRLSDTIKESDDGQRVARTLERAKLWAVQTPQTFRVEMIRRALQEVRRRGLHVTDDTAACELIGQPVRLIESPWPNPKATSPLDLAWIEFLLARQREPPNQKIEF